MKVLDACFGVAVVGFVAWISYGFFSAQDAAVHPRIILSREITPSIVLAGTHMNIHFRAQINKACPYETHWSLVRKSDGVEVARIIQPLTPAPVAFVGQIEDRTDKRLIPESVTPGSYSYISTVYDICPERTFITVHQGLDVTIR